MGLFFNKKKKNTKDTNEFVPVTVSEALETHGRRAGMLTLDGMASKCDALCAQVKSCEGELAEIRREYYAVTAYISDVQKIDALDSEAREEVMDAARNMVRLNKECNQIKAGRSIIAEVQYRHLEQYEDDIPSQIKFIKGQEEYLKLIRDDLKQLEGEKGAVLYDQECADKKRRTVKNVSIGGCVSVIMMMSLLFVINSYTEAELTVPFFITGVMAFLIVLYVVYGLKSSSFDRKSAATRLNRVIVLTNKVKIKYVNCTNGIDYCYEKYRVNSGKELEELWELYKKEKESRVKYRFNTEQMAKDNNRLIKILTSHGITDPDLWVHQPEAFLDPREMVEVRHHLNVKRKKLRTRLEGVQKQYDEALGEVRELYAAYPQYKESFDMMLVKHGMKSGW